MPPLAAAPTRSQGRETPCCHPVGQELESTRVLEWLCLPLLWGILTLEQTWWHTDPPVPKMYVHDV